MDFYWKLWIWNRINSSWNACQRRRNSIPPTSSPLILCGLRHVWKLGLLSRQINIPFSFNHNRSHCIDCLGASMMGRDFWFVWRGLLDWNGLDWNSWLCALVDPIPKKWLCKTRIWFARKPRDRNFWRRMNGIFMWLLWIGCIMLWNMDIMGKVPNHPVAVRTSFKWQVRIQSKRLGGFGAILLLYFHVSIRTMEWRALQVHLTILIPANKTFGHLVALKFAGY